MWWLGYLEGVRPVVWPWFFHTDYLALLRQWWSNRKCGGNRRDSHVLGDQGRNRDDQNGPPGADGSGLRIQSPATEGEDASTDELKDYNDSTEVTGISQVTPEESKPAAEDDSESAPLLGSEIERYIIETHCPVLLN